MRTTVVTPTHSGSELSSSGSLAAGSSHAPVVTEAVETAPIVVTTADDEMSHMRRRLFRTLDHPERSLVAIDCGSVPIDQIQQNSDRFFSDATFRDEHNLVLAIPTDEEFADSPAFDFVQSIKQQAFANHLDGKVSWLLIHEADCELPALANLVQQQGGQWHVGQSD